MVLPGNELGKVVIEGNANHCIKGGRVGVTGKVAGDSKDFQCSPGCSLVGPLMPASPPFWYHYICNFLQMASQIYDHHTVGGDTEGHASMLPVHLRDDLANSLGSASRCQNDVLGNPVAVTVSFPRGAINFQSSGWQ